MKTATLKISPGIIGLLGFSLVGGWLFDDVRVGVFVLASILITVLMEINVKPWIWRWNTK